VSISKRLDGSRPKLPLVRSWKKHDFLPRRVLDNPGRRLSRVPSRGDAPTGPLDRPFDFCGHIERLGRSIASRMPEFCHLDFARILIAANQARSPSAHGLQARVTPLRFQGGRLTRKRRGITYQVQRYSVADQDLLYLVSFCLPRFLDLDFDEKFITLFHELYHISPAFDGDLRRHEGRYCIHSHSQKRYDQHMAELARKYVAGGADPALHAFFYFSFAELEARHKSVVGVVVPRPKIIPLLDATAARNGP
jgi:hypothetical protein